MAAENQVDEMDALLNPEEHAPWEAIDVEASAQGAIHVRDLFATNPEDVLRTTQKRGAIKLGEFKEKSNIVFPAFEGSTILTMGLDSQQPIDYERLWRQELRKGKASRPTSWAPDVVVEAYVLNIKNAADPDKDGLLQPLLRRWQQGGCSLAVFGLPAVQAVITWKWSAFARRLLLWELLVFLVWLGSFFAFTWLFQDEDLTLTLRQLVSTQRGAMTVLFELIALAAMVPFLMLEQGTLQAYGFSGWFSIWNGLDIATYILQLWATLMHIGRVDLKSDALSVVLALQCIFLLFRLQYYSRVFKSTRFAFLETIRDVISEIRYYFVAMLIIMWGFSLSFYILFRRDQGVHNFDTLATSFLKVYMSASGGLDYTEMLKSHVPVAASLLNVAYAFVMGMVLFNLLIGIMSNSLNKATEHEALKLLLHKAEIIDELEATLPSWLEQRFRRQWYPTYVHILRVDPDRLDRVDLDSPWEKEGEGAQAMDALKEHTEATASKLEAIQQQLALQAAQLSRLEHLLAKAAGTGLQLPAHSGMASS